MAHDLATWPFTSSMSTSVSGRANKPCKASSRGCTCKRIQGESQWRSCEKLTVVTLCHDLQQTPNQTLSIYPYIRHMHGYTRNFRWATPWLSTTTAVARFCADSSPHFCVWNPRHLWTLPPAVQRFCAIAPSILARDPLSASHFPNKTCLATLCVHVSHPPALLGPHGLTSPPMLIRQH